jgi:hypothetical protein
MSTALPNHCPVDLSSTFWTWLTRAPVNPEIVLEVATPINPINTGALLCNAILQYLANTS